MESANQEPQISCGGKLLWLGAKDESEHAPREPTARPHFAAHAPHEHTVATMSFAVSSSASLAAGRPSSVRPRPSASPRASPPAPPPAAAPS